MCTSTSTDVVLSFEDTAVLVTVLVFATSVGSMQAMADAVLVWPENCRCEESWCVSCVFVEAQYLFVASVYLSVYRLND